jgi:uncharacterized protein YycO
MLVVACNNADNYPPVENALDAGRQFIDASYNGNFKRAAMLLSSNVSNTALLKSNFTANFNSRNSTEKNVLKKSSITILSTQEVEKDKILLIKFINNYTNTPTDLKVINEAGKWVVDLTHSFK